MGKGRSNVRIPVGVKPTIDESTMWRSLKAVRAELDTFTLSDLHDAIDALGIFLSDADQADFLEQSRIDNLTASRDVADLATRAKRMRKIGRSLQSLHTKASDLLNAFNLYGLYGPSSALEEKARLTAIALEEESAKSRLSDSIPLSEILAGTLALPDEFPLEKLPLFAPSGKALRPRWKPFSAFVPGQREVEVNTYGQLKAHLASGIPTRMNSYGLSYASSSRTASMPVTSVRVPRVLLAQAVAAFTREGPPSE